MQDTGFINEMIRPVFLFYKEYTLSKTSILTIKIKYSENARW